MALWREILKENFTKFEELADFLNLSAELREQIIPKARFRLNVPKRLAEKMGKNTLDDPILRQFVPLKDELIPSPNFVPEPLQDTCFRKTEKMIHKYQRRALLLATSSCAMHCRFCFRQNFPYEKNLAGFAQDLAYIEKETSLNEIILSGGDPLSLDNSHLKKLFDELEKIPHIERIRFHTRFPIGIPERIDDLFLAILENSSKQIVFIIHCNHPKELDQEVVYALKKIQKLGIPVLNQAVLLRGVNDKETTLLELSETLVRGGILPYYLHLLDLVEGASHFLVSDERAKELIHYLERHTSGYAVPKLVREVPGEPCKSLVG